MAPENTTTDQVEEEQGGTSVTPRSKGNPIDALLALAESQIGYTEKDNVTYIDDDVENTSNAGSGNCTKYARDLSGDNETTVTNPKTGQPEDFNTYYQIPTDGIYYGNKQRVAWCSMFVDWCFCMVFGYKAMKQMTFHGQDGAGVSNSRNHYEANGRFITSDPQPGDEVFFNGHTGLVWKVEGGYVTTIEGNTSGKSGVVSEGGCVCDKKYSLGSSSIVGYGRPDWSKAPEGFLYTGASGGTLGVDYINTYITSCTRNTLSINVSSASPLNAESITAILYKGEVDVEPRPERPDSTVEDDEDLNNPNAYKGTNEIEKNPYPSEDTPLTLKGLYNEGRLAKVEIDIAKLPPNELTTLELSASSGSGSHTAGLGFTTPQEYPNQVQNVEIVALRYSYDTVFDTDYNVYFSRLLWKKPTSDWGYWKDKKDWDTGYTVYLIRDREIYKELFNFTYEESHNGIPVNLPDNLQYNQNSLYFDLNKVLLSCGIKNLRELGTGSAVQIGVRTWVLGKYTDDDEEIQLSLPELPKGSNTLQLDYKTNVTNRCYLNVDKKYARLSIYKK